MNYRFHTTTEDYGNITRNKPRWKRSRQYEARPNSSGGVDLHGIYNTWVNNWKQFSVSRRALERIVEGAQKRVHVFAVEYPDSRHIRVGCQRVTVATVKKLLDMI